MKRRLVRVSLALILLAGTAGADVRLPALFSDHMVLQQGRTCPVWGWADPGEEVTVSIAGQRHTVAASAPAGRWRVDLDPLDVEDGPYTLTITGRNRIEIDDVLAGEVWLCSGQSNMEMGVSLAEDAAAEREAATYPRLRMFTVDNAIAATPTNHCQGTWVVCSPGTVFRFSAAGYFFGRDLHLALDRPIGLINSSWGGTPIKAWTSGEALATIDHFAPIVATMDLPSRQLDPRLDKSLPTTLFNAMIHPLIPYALAGVIWYQGEADALAPFAHLYAEQLETMIGDWRTRWGDTMPFAWVQLPEFEPRTETARRGWCIIREQMVNALRIPRTGMAVTLGLGDADDVHPKAKQGVGRRLSLWALAEVYAIDDLVYRSPRYAEHTVEDNEVTVRFEHAPGGLSSIAPDITGFVIAGADREWVPAEASIDWDEVTVWSPAVSAPVAVRYAWAPNPQWSLVNGADLPAAPFRTDTWDIRQVPEVTRSDVPHPVAPVRSPRSLQIDGELDDAFWTGLAWHSLKPLQPAQKPVAPGEFTIAWGTDSCLYLAIRCLEPDMDALKITAQEDGDRAIWNGDCIELLLETPTHAYYQLAVSPAGAVVDLDRKPGLEYLWNSHAAAAARCAPTEWTLELRIPVVGPGDTRHNVLNYIAAAPPTEEAAWHFNLCRQRVRRDDREYSAFSPPGGGSYHNRATFARLVVETREP